MTENHCAGPLEGVRAIELGTLLAGPYCGRLLAEFGAEVIKVELPGRGDPLREWGRHRYRGRSLWWPVQSRNKKLITLDLHSERGKDLLRRLVEKSDVLIENFRPGTLERWGVGPDELRRINPGLIVARVSGYGQTGPYSDRAGFAAAGEAMGGLRHINGYPDQAPPRMGVSLGDSLAAMFATIGVLMALHQRGLSGRGQVVDASIVESCYALLESIVPEYGKLGEVRGPTGTVLEHIAPSNVYRSRDEKWVVIAANSPNLWQRLCQVIGRPDLLTDERFQTHWLRGQNQKPLDEIISGWAAERDAAEIDRLLNAAGVVCGPVYSVADIFSDPHFQARRMLLSMEDPELGEVTAPGIVPKLSETPGEARFTGAWALGAHNREVYCDLLGLPAAELAELEAAGVI
ncbi:MAG: CoA transferase [Candidatus Dormibacteraeota bacterium]|uniref:CoA transferase n=1 Tax=Candidatus Dormiibacter inghamiae TaxID=3127013 RepID=A0A934KC92_9BACT|nr:CoA transferase [Candidatus Dormibacteraeota bacterium]MBJ7605772.1 CoA transferase [Candidatus Dormibacteraeota bacterium]